MIGQWTLNWSGSSQQFFQLAEGEKFEAISPQNEKAAAINGRGNKVRNKPDNFSSFLFYDFSLSGLKVYFPWAKVRCTAELIFAFSSSLCVGRWSETRA